MSRKWLNVVTIASLSVLGLGSGVAWHRYRSARVYCYLGHQLIPAYTLAEVEAQLNPLAETFEALPVRIEQAPEKTYSLKEWGVRLDVPAVQEAIRAEWLSKPIWERTFQQPRVQVAPIWTVDHTRFERVLSEYRFLEREPKPARIRYENGQITVIPEILGKRVDPKQTLRALLKQLETIPAGDALDFVLVMEPIAPRLTASQIQQITGEMARYTTYFPGYQVHRNHNIRLAAQALNGVVLLPGERLSYNEVVGERTIRRGFRPAPIIVRGEKRLGIGGGICQVSSTLFNSVLLGQLKIVRRANHSIPITYVPLGRDATVNDTGLDLVIENSHPHPIAIATQVGRSSVTIIILGVANPNRRVVLKTERTILKSPPVQETPTPDLPQGIRKVRQKGSAGVRVVLWRWVYEGDRLVSKERVATSIYRSQPRIVLVGTKPSEEH